MPKISGKKRKKEENKSREDDEVQQFPERESCAMFSVPGMSTLKARNEGVSDLFISKEGVKLVIIKIPEKNVLWILHQLPVVFFA